MADGWRDSVRIFAAEAATIYGRDLHGVFLFGSRARRDHDEDSDADIAVVLADEAFDFWRAKEMVGDIAYRRLLADGLYIQAIPIALSEWSVAAPTVFLSRIKHDAEPVIT